MRLEDESVRSHEDSCNEALKRSVDTNDDAFHRHHDKQCRRLASLLRVSLVMAPLHPSTCIEELTPDDDACCCGLSLFTSCSSTVSTSFLLASYVVHLVMLSSNHHIDSFIHAHSVACCRRRGRVMLSMCVEWVIHRLFMHCCGLKSLES